MYNAESFTNRFADMFIKKILNSPEFSKRILDTLKNQIQLDELSSDVTQKTITKTEPTIINKNDTSYRGVRVYFSNCYYGSGNDEPEEHTVLSVEDAEKRIRSLVPIDIPEIKPSIWCKKNIIEVGNGLIKKYKNFKGFISVKVDYDSSRDSVRKSKYIAKHFSDYWGEVENVSDCTYAPTFTDALLMTHHFLESKNSWRVNSRYSPVAFVDKHRIEFRFQKTLNDPVIYKENISGEVMNYFITAYDFTSKSKAPKFTSCIYKGNRHRIINDNKQSVLLDNGHWVGKYEVSELKTI